MSGFSLNAQTLRTLCAAGFVAPAVLFTQSRDALREVTRPIVTGLLQAVGIQAQDHGTAMTVGRLEVPWTRDCAGVNLLLIMLALAVWVNRQEKAGVKYWLRVAAMVPAAQAANVLRVLTLIAYRSIAWPAVESPQTPYFMGFIRMVPFLTLITPCGGRPLSHALLETLHAAAVVALLAPMTGMPNGSLITMAAVLALAQCRIRQDFWRLRRCLTALWVVAGFSVAMMNLESFWLPWLLCCPLLLDLVWLRTPGGFLVLLSTHSMVTMQSWAPVIGWTGIALAILPWLKNTPTPAAAPATATPARPGPPWQRFTLTSACILCFALPFPASTLLSMGQVQWMPPLTVQSRPPGSRGYEVRLPGQSDHIALATYGATGRDRHHTVQVCLKYRGTELTPEPDHSGVYSDGKHWLREFFLQDQQWIAEYGTYLKNTFRPGADPGVHLIFISPMDRVTPDLFAKESSSLASTFHDLCTGKPTPAHNDLLAIQP